MKFDFSDPTRAIKIPPLQYLKAVARIFAHRLLPLRLSLTASLWVASIQVRLGPRRRGLMKGLLRHVLPGNLSEREVRHALCLSHAIKRIGCRTYAPAWRRSRGWLVRNFRPEGLEYLDAARRAGEGAIILATGTGLKVWTSMILRQLGYDVRPIQRRHVTPDVLLLLRWDRAIGDVMRYPRDHEALVHMKRLLDLVKRGEWVSHVGHGQGHDMPIKGNLLGFEIESGRGPWFLARLTGAPLIPAVTLVDKDLTCRLVVGSPIHVPASGPVSSALESAFQSYLDFVAERVVPMPWNFIRPSHWERWFNPGAGEADGREPGPQ
jgi:lauroyl/myristoyl acyltransferase